MVLANDQTLEEIKEKFPPSISFNEGANWILPDGKFISVKTHTEIDEFILNKYNLDIDEYLDEFKTSIMSEGFNCVRINDGTVFSGDFYIQLPSKNISSEQIISLEEWLDSVNGVGVMDVSTSDDQFATYDLSEVPPDYIIKRIRRYYSSKILYEDKCKSSKRLQRVLRESLFPN